MTICIAGIAENKKIIAVTDRMLTIGAPVRTAFEIGANDKAIKIGNKVIALFAGDVIKANTILKKAKILIGNNLDQSVEKMAEIVQEAFKKQFIEDVEDGLLSKWGLDRTKFVNKQKELDEELVRNINQTIANYKIDVQIIIAGMTVAEPHIFRIESPGIITVHDSLGYCCIGSGSQHATFSLIESEYNPSFIEEKGVHAIIQAKKRAQYDPGVGNMTDIVLINDSYVKLEEDKIEKIDQILENSGEKIKTARDACAEAIKKEIYG